MTQRTKKFIKIADKIIKLANISSAILVNNNKQGLILRDEKGKISHWLECDLEAAQQAFESVAALLSTHEALQIEGVCHVPFKHIEDVTLGQLKDGPACLVIKGSDKRAWVFITENDCSDLPALLDTVSQILVGDHKSVAIDLSKF